MGKMFDERLNQQAREAAQAGPLALKGAMGGAKFAQDWQKSNQQMDLDQRADDRAQAQFGQTSRLNEMKLQEAQAQQDLLNEVVDPNTGMTRRTRQADMPYMQFQRQGDWREQDVSHRDRTFTEQQKMNQSSLANQATANRIANRQLAMTEEQVARQNAADDALGREKRAIAVMQAAYASENPSVIENAMFKLQQEGIDPATLSIANVTGRQNAIRATQAEQITGAMTPQESSALADIEATQKEMLGLTELKNLASKYDANRGYVMDDQALLDEISGKLAAAGDPSSARAFQADYMKRGATYGWAGRQEVLNKAVNQLQQGLINRIETRKANSPAHMHPQFDAAITRLSSQMNRTGQYNPLTQPVQPSSGIQNASMRQ